MKSDPHSAEELAFAVTMAWDEFTDAWDAARGSRGAGDTLGRVLRAKDAVENAVEAARVPSAELAALRAWINVIAPWYHEEFHGKKFEECNDEYCQFARDIPGPKEAR